MVAFVLPKGGGVGPVLGVCCGSAKEQGLRDMGCDIDSNAGWRGRRNTGLRQDCSLSHPHVGRDAILETATRSALRVRHVRPNVEQSRHAVGDGTCAASPSQACVDRGANKRWHRCRQVEVPQTFARS